MKLRSITRLGLGIFAAFALTACGNGNNDVSKIVQNIPKAFAKKEDPKPLTPEQVGRALAASEASVFLFEVEARKAQFLMLDIQRNGPYATFGNSARQVVVMRDGMITSTRGLGGDLMSSEEDQLLAMVRSKTSGTASYDLRFLTSEDVTQVRRYSCYVSTGGSVPVAAGLVNTTGTLVNAKCSAADGVSPDFTNSYIVSKDGYILSGKQWVGTVNGYLLSQVLRR